MKSQNVTTSAYADNVASVTEFQQEIMEAKKLNTSTNGKVVRGIIIAVNTRLRVQFCNKKPKIRNLVLLLHYVLQLTKLLFRIQPSP